MSSVERYRLVIAAVEPGRVGHAVSDLEANGLTLSDLCLAATPGALESVRRSVLDPSRKLLSPLLDVEAITVAPSAAIVATINRPMTNYMRDVLTPVPGAGQRACWIDANSRTELLGHMAGGAVVVVAGPLSAVQHQTGTQVLLRHSNHPVQGHFLIPPASTRPQG